MCSDLFVAATCLLYAICTAYMCAYLWGHHSWLSLCLFVTLAVVVAFQIDSDCDIAFTKIGAATFALMLFCTCGSVYKIISQPRSGHS